MLSRLPRSLAPENGEGLEIAPHRDRPVVGGAGVGENVLGRAAKTEDQVGEHQRLHPGPRRDGSDVPDAVR